MENLVNGASKNILILGNLGYIGPVLTNYLKSKYPNYKLSGFDSGYFLKSYTHTTIADEVHLNVQHYGDVRNFNADLLKNIDCVIALAAISNDPIGNIFEKQTIDINCYSILKIAEMAKNNGVKSFVFASSCSVYGFAEEGAKTESSALNPLTAYAKSKIMTEEGLAKITSENFKVTALRFATACGMSSRLRLDLVLNDFVAGAITSGEINILSDGKPWRPLIDVKDMAKAIDWAIHRSDNEKFIAVNAGSNDWNFQVKDLAMAVNKLLPETKISINQNAQPDKRSYKVSFDLFKKIAPNHQPKLTLDETISELIEGISNTPSINKKYRESEYIRLNVIKNLIERKKIDSDLFILNP